MYYQRISRIMCVSLFVILFQAHCMFIATILNCKYSKAGLSAS